MNGVTWFISLNEWEPPLTAVEVDGRRYTADDVVAVLRAARALTDYAEAQAGAMLPISAVNFVTGGHYRALREALEGKRHAT